MKAVISTTYSDTYLFFLPITTFLWNRLGVDVICFFPHLTANPENNRKVDLLYKTIRSKDLKIKAYEFDAPEHKQATYAQCSRLYAACLDLPYNEMLVTSDCDMAVFKIPKNGGMGMTIFGYDLTPQNQVPICYISGTVEDWNKRFNPEGKTYQQCLDDELGGLEAEHFRGNFWSRDQELAYKKILGGEFPFNHANLLPRTNGDNQFSTHRIDRDDAYFMDRLNQDVIDYHMHRPGYTDDNFEKILSVIKYFYPNESFQWMVEYQQAYKQLL